MYIADFSINVLTLLGIVLAIGIVVDDAIVVLENIYTKIEDGMNPVDAATKGSAEIFFAVVSTTVALAAVFLPVIFLQGLTGRLFREFGIVIAGSVIISSFVALTLTPMLGGKILKSRDKETHSWFYMKTEPFFVRMDKFQDTRKNLSEVVIRLKDMERILEKITEAKAKEDAELASWKEETRKIKSYLSTIEQSLFNKIQF